MKLIWERSSTPVEFIPMLEILGTEYAIAESGSGTKINFKKADHPGLYLNVEKSSDSITVTANTVSTAARGISMALAGMTGKNSSDFRRIGIMPDFSRNMVMTPEHIKKWLRQLALYGGNTVYLYMEDTYKMADEPFFGFGRGGLTIEELQDLDRYAAALGIELVGCIQTLAHMAQVLQWNAYSQVKDTENCLLAGEEKTYEFIGKMFDFWSKALGSRRIHIGMDEAHDLGRGKYLDRYGKRPTFDIMTEHLQKCAEIAKTRGLEPMIWSDMFFTLAGGSYYKPDAEFPDDLASNIPETISLVYWDYYNRDAEFYSRMIRKHRELGSEPLMASGLWTWYRWWYDPWQSERTVRPCIEACRKEKIQEIFFTMWKDNGAYCCYDSGLAGIAMACDLCYGVDDHDLTARRFAAVSSADYDVIITAGRMTMPMGFELVEEASPVINPVSLLWDDPLLGIATDSNLQLVPDFETKILSLYDELLEKLSPHRDSNAAGDIDFAVKLITAVKEKVAIRAELPEAYYSRDREKLHKIASQDIPALLKSLQDFEAAFRRQWLKSSRPQGMEVIQIRNAGTRARMEETALRINELLAGKTASIPELDERLPKLKNFLFVGRYHRVASASVIQ